MAAASFYAALESAVGGAQAGPVSTAPVSIAAAGGDFAVSSDGAEGNLGARNAVKNAQAASSESAPADAFAPKIAVERMGASDAAAAAATAWAQFFGAGFATSGQAAQDALVAADPEANAVTAAWTQVFDAGFMTSGQVLQSAQISADPGANAAASGPDSAQGTFTQVAELLAAATTQTMVPMPVVPDAVRLSAGMSNQEQGANLGSAWVDAGMPQPDSVLSAKMVAPEKSASEKSASAVDGSPIELTASTAPVLPVTNASNPLTAFSTLLANAQASHVSISGTPPAETPAQGISDRTFVAASAPAKEIASDRVAANGESQSSGAPATQVSQTSSDDDAFNGQSGSDACDRRGPDRAPAAAGPTTVGATTEGALAAGISATLNQGAAMASATPAATAIAGSQQSAAANSSATAAPTSAALGGATANLPSQPAASDTLRAAELLARASNSEMHLSIRTEELGTVELRAALHQDSLSATIGVTRGDVQAVLSSELPGLHQAMAEHSLRFETFNVMKGSLGSWTGNSGGFQPPHQNPQRSRANGAFPAVARVDAGQELDARPSNAAAPVIDSSVRLSIHV